MTEKNRLYRKTIIWNGDSICAGKRFDDTKEADAWAGRIAAKNKMKYKNYAIGGGTVSEGLPPLQNGNERHSVSGTLERMYEEFPDADYIVIEGGTNDADLLGNATLEGKITRLGEVDKNYFGGDFDRTTFCGALESVFYRATKYWHGKKIAYIIAHKMGPDMVDFKNRRVYFDKAAEVCRKWGIPYIDLWESCYLNPYLESMYDASKDTDENVAAGSFYADGQHLTAAGYELTTDIIEAWLKTI